MTTMMRGISLDLSYFNSLNLYLINEDNAVAVLKDYYYYYRYNYNNYESFGVMKESLSSIEDTGII